VSRSISSVKSNVDLAELSLSDRATAGGIIILSFICLVFVTLKVLLIIDCYVSMVDKRFDFWSLSSFLDFYFFCSNNLYVKIDFAYRNLAGLVMLSVLTS
jgi:hypothetical protein